MSSSAATRFIAIVALGFGAVQVAAAQEVPPALTTLVSKAKLDGAVAAWCRGSFRAGHRGGFAVALTTAPDRGRYLVLDRDGAVSELGTFERAPELACYSRAEVERLNATIGTSGTIQGRIVPRWSTTIVCAFGDATSATCWQHSPRARAFITIGGWTT